MSAPIVTVSTPTINKLECRTIESGASSDTPRIQLGPTDWKVPIYLCNVSLFFYDATSWLAEDSNRTPDQFMSPSKMYESTVRVVQEYYPLLAGRFVKTDDGCAEIEYQSGKGAEYREATTEAKIADLALSAQQYTSTSSLPSTLELVSPFSVMTVFDSPILSFQYTKFACGGVCLGVRIHHWMCDAEGYFSFINDLSEIYNTGKLAVPPSHNRSIISASKEQIEAAKQPGAFEPLGYCVPPAPTVAPVPVAGTPAVAPRVPVFPPLRTMRFEASEVEGIKRAGTPSNGGWVSTFEAIAAHLYRHTWLARYPDVAIPPAGRLQIATNWRKKLDIVPANFFGNAQLLHPVDMPHKDMRDVPLSELAVTVHETLTHYTPELIRSTLAWIAAQPNKMKITQKVIPGVPFLGITQWNKTHMYIPFESNVEPLRVCFPNGYGSAFEGFLLFGTPSSTGGAIDIVIGMTEEAMKRLEANTEFRQYRVEAK